MRKLIILIVLILIFSLCVSNIQYATVSTDIKDTPQTNIKSTYQESNTTSMQEELEHNIKALDLRETGKSAAESVQPDRSNLRTTYFVVRTISAFLPAIGLLGTIVILIVFGIKWFRADRESKVMLKDRAWIYALSAIGFLFTGLLLSPLLNLAFLFIAR